MNLCDHIPYLCNAVTSQSYAQYGVQANPPTNSDIPMFVLFQEGEEISLNDTEIHLEKGSLYLINYIFSATTEMNSYLQLTPKINGALKLLYSTTSSSSSAIRDASVSASFTIRAEDNITLSFNLTYPDTVRNIDISGSVSVTALSKLNHSKCQ